jgi:DNA-binding winged helix-turn-helix (wHTH) protein
MTDALPSVLLRVRKCLARATGSWVPKQELFTGVWTVHGLTVPKTANWMVHQAVAELRAGGWVIESRPGRNSPGFKLVRFP